MQQGVGSREELLNKPWRWKGEWVSIENCDVTQKFEQSSTNNKRLYTFNHLKASFISGQQLRFMKRGQRLKNAFEKHISTHN